MVTTAKNVTKMKWRNPYDEEENAAVNAATAIDFTGDPGMTLQAPAEEQDINVIMKRFGVKDGSALPRWDTTGAMYGDVSGIPNDAVEAAEILRRGRVAFMTLPATVRREFDSPEHMHTWLQDPKNADRAIELGILEKRRQAATLDTLQATLEKVSTSTSSDKEELVPPPKPSKKEQEK